MRILVCGGKLCDENKSAEYLSKLLAHCEIEIVIHGAASGADTGGDKFAQSKGIETMVFHADWRNMDVTPCTPRQSKYGGLYNAAAGAIRNEKIAVEGKPDLVIAFPGGPGTKNMIDIACRKGFNVISIPKGWENFNV